MTQLDRIERKIDDLADRQHDLATRKSAHLALAILQSLRDKVIPDETEKIMAAVDALDRGETETETEVSA